MWATSSGRHASGSGLPRRSASPGDFARSSEMGRAVPTALLTTRPSTVLNADSSNTPRGMCRICVDGDIVAARAAFVRAGNIGERFSDTELLTRPHRGGPVHDLPGRNRGGPVLLDEAMVSVEAREIPPMAVGDAYCTVIDACSRIVRHSPMRTVDRNHSRAWCDAQHGLVLYSGHCLAPPRRPSDAARRVVRRRLGCQGCMRRTQRKPMNAPTLGGALLSRPNCTGCAANSRWPSEPTSVPTRSVANRSRAWLFFRLAQGRVDVATAQLRRRLGGVGSAHRPRPNSVCRARDPGRR